MIITYHGESFVKVQYGDLVVSLNSDGANQVRIGGRDPFIISGPGEYEVSNVFVSGFSTAGPHGKGNIIYSLSLEGLRLTHLGLMEESKIPEAIMSGIGEVDILLAPLDGALSPAAAYRLALTFSPKLILPLSAAASLTGQFLKEAGLSDAKAGAEKAPPIDKLVIKKKDVLEKEGEVMVLRAV